MTARGISRRQRPTSEEALTAYFAKRALEEGDLSLASSDPTHARAHSDLAARYRKLAQQFEAQALTAGPLVLDDSG